MSEDATSSSVIGYDGAVPFLGRKMCPHCKAPTWVELATHWEDDLGTGMREEIRCSGCDAKLYREKGTGLMTPEQHVTWKAQRALPTAKLRK